jgi:hypothetical protein
LNWIFLFFEKNWPYHQREMGKIEKNRFWNLKKSGHTTRGKWNKLKCARKIWNEKFENFYFWNLKWKILKFFIFETRNEKFEYFIFEIWNEISYSKFEKNRPYHRRNMKKIGNEEIIYFVCATEIKLPIIPLYHLCMVHRKRALDMWKKEGVAADCFHWSWPMYVVHAV